MSKEYRNNHYVPIWYQKRFVVNPKTDREIHYLDLDPPKFFDSKGGVHIRNAIRRQGFKKCFAEEDLYTTNFNNIESEKIEKYFFGDIDTRGRKAVKKCADFFHPWDGSDFFNELLYYGAVAKLKKFYILVKTQ
ncbi:MAG: hypothetical protein US25_C0042G0001 [Candidatus Moranbacteria bacterium GW2011_GWE1_36_7]|nr:MAG: hypothetical protein UR99_C0055G0001 [Candidatus Moranbacteria bacterium GW2011_GWD2_36_12]KKQ13132.1 MAG: hypothetical protein US25_C0042G0001 [Candidatus Moranbacteria bacterium GW2011_GWE1_36_7]